MPIHVGQDKKGPFVQFGNLKKYYFSPSSIRSFNSAHNKALKQGAAIHLSKYYKK